MHGWRNNKTSCETWLCFLRIVMFCFTEDTTPCVHITPEKFVNPCNVFRPHFAGEIWKRNFISTVRPTKTLFKTEEFEKACLAFYCGRKTFLKQFFENDGATMIMWFPSKIVKNGDCCGFKFLRRGVDEALACSLDGSLNFLLLWGAGEGVN